MSIQRIWGLSASAFGNSQHKTFEKCEWNCRGFAAVTGSSHPFVYVLSTVTGACTIYDRIPVTSSVTWMAWTRGGDLLAVSQEKSSLITLWNTDDKIVNTIEINMKIITCISWSLSGLYLAMGTNKGNVVIYSRLNQKKIPILGKHNKAIGEALWSSQETFALASEDKTITVNNVNGDTILQLNVKGHAKRMSFHQFGNSSLLGYLLDDGKTFNAIAISGSDTSQDTPALSPGKRILDYDFTKSQENVILVMENGSIAITSVLLSQASNGNGLTVSLALVREISFWPNARSVNMARIAANGQVFLFGTERCIKVYGYDSRTIDKESESSFSETVSNVVIDELGSLMREDRQSLLEFLTVWDWSPDAGTLLVSDKEGNIHGYSLGSSITCAICPNLLAFTSSDKTKVHFKSIYPSMIKYGDIEPESNPIVSLQLYASNSNPFLHKLVIQTSTQISLYYVRRRSDSHETFSNLKWARSVSDAIQHSLDFATETLVYISRSSMNVVIAYPGVNNNGRVIVTTIVANNVWLDNGCLLVSSPDSLRYHSLPENPNSMEQPRETFKISLVTEIQKTCCHPSKSLGRVIWADVDGSVWLSNVLKAENGNHNPLQLLKSTLSTKVKQVYFATSLNLRNCHPNMFVVVSEAEVTLYVYLDWTVLEGDKMQVLKITDWKVPRGSQIFRFILDDYERPSLECLTPSNSLVISAITGLDVSTNGRLLYLLGAKKQLYQLIRSKQTGLTDNDMKAKIFSIGNFMLNLLDLESAFKFYSEMGIQANMAVLDKLIREVDDKRIIAGYVSFLLLRSTGISEDRVKAGKLALDYFMSSSKPRLALELAISTFDYENGIKIAQTFAQDLLPHVLVQYALFLERAGRYTDSFEYYEKAKLMALKGKDEVDCRFGLTRMTIRMGSIGKALDMLKCESDLDHVKHCAEILLSMGMYGEAGNLFEKAKTPEKAIECYLQVKNFSKVGYLLPFTNKNKKLYRQYARAKEAEGDMRSALEAFTTIESIPEQTRLLLALQQVPQAIALIRSTENSEGAQMIATFFEGVGKPDHVVEFWLLAGRKEDAFRVAQANSIVPQYAETLEKLDLATKDDYVSLASFLSNASTHNPYLAGKFFFQSGNYPKAVQSLLQCKNDERAMELAIKVVEESKSSTIARQVIDYFMSNYEGVTGEDEFESAREGQDMSKSDLNAGASSNKSGRYLFKLYLALDQYSEAIRILKLVSQDDWHAGSYRKARDFLAAGVQDLGRKKLPIPRTVAHSLMLLHSYLITKSLIKMNLQNHATGILLRVCQNLSNFQAHKCDILISAILQCQKTGYLKSMQQLAQQLIVKEGPAFKAYLEAKSRGNESNAAAVVALSKHRRKWESLVRRPDPEAKDEPAQSIHQIPCCKCGIPGDPVKLVCQQGCKSILPYCILTGYRIDARDFGFCQGCYLPWTASLLSLYTKSMQSNQCPMCLSEIIDVKESGPTTYAEWVPIYESLYGNSSTGKQQDEEPDDMVDFIDDDEYDDDDVNDDGHDDGNRNE